MFENQTPEAFDRLGLCKPLLRALQHAGYSHPTPIQREAIPAVLAGRDVIGCAQTGTGKTAAFSLPLLHLIDARVADEPKIRGLIVTPTRELAAQISASLSTYGAHLEDLWHTTLFGGVSEKAQIRELARGVDILVATPGRLLDLLGRGLLSLDAVELLVLDEADTMLDMGFLPDVRRIVAALPTERQTLFFSATMPAAVRALAQSMLRDPVTISVDPPSSACARIEQRLYFVENQDKRRLLVHLLGGAAGARTLVFSRTKHGANRIVDFLEQHEISAAALHGNKSQAARTRALDGFRGGSTAVLVATDIAARGIDVEGVSHVINFDLPSVPETFVHRIGRTARAQASGIALSFCDTEEIGCLAGIERLLGERLDRANAHPFALSPAPSSAEILRAEGRKIPSARTLARGQSPARTGSSARR